MKAAVVPKPGAPYQVKDVPEAPIGPGHVRVRVHACGYCYSDENIRLGHSGNAFPRIPGHEVAGVIADRGADVPDVWQPGDRVGVGWHGGHCLSCDACRAGDFLRCPDRLGCGTSFDGGFAESVVVHWTALARIPAALDDVAAAPLMCAGITVFNALRNSGASWGDTVAVHGLGGLGHLAVQFADKMGFRTVAVSRGAEKAELAAQLGADDYVDADEQDPGRALRALGGAKAIVTTAPKAAPMRPLFAGLGGRGRLVVVGVAAGELGAAAADFIARERGIVGSVIGTPSELERCLAFAARKGVRPWTETFSLDRIGEAAKRLREGRLRFRAVLTPLS